MTESPAGALRPDWPAPVGVQAAALAHRFLVVFHALQLAQLQLGDLEAKAVGAQVHSGEAGAGLHKSGGLERKRCAPPRGACRLWRICATGLAHARGKPAPTWRMLAARDVRLLVNE